MIDEGEAGVESLEGNVRKGGGHCMWYWDLGPDDFVSMGSS